MKKWIRRIIGITECKIDITMLHSDLNKAFNRIERLEKKARFDRKPMRYDQIERARKRRKKAA